MRGGFSLAKSLGNRLPEDLFRRLSDPNISGKGARVIIFTTVDEQGWPHHAMLSPYEVVTQARSQLLMMTYRGSRSTRNIRRTGIVTLLVVDEQMSYYVKGRCEEMENAIPEAPGETVFQVNVVDVLEDKLPTAKVATGITFEGYDPGMPREKRSTVFQQLLAVARKSAQSRPAD